VEGRDIGTVVAPQAALKVYLSADPGARAHRRSSELARGSATDVATVEAALRERDAYDSGRTTAPLSAAHDAVAIDSTHLSLREVIAEIVGLARERVGGSTDV
jgi:cytidylate kinase